MKLKLRRVPNLGELQQARDTARTIRNTIRDLRDSRAAAKLRFQNQAEHELKELPLKPAERQRLVNAKVNNAIRDVKRAQDEILLPNYKNLGAAQELADEAREHYTNRIRMLDLSTLGSSRRAVLTQNLAHAGDVALTAAAEDALARNDAELAAAVVASLDGRPISKRPFHAAELANAITSEAIDVPAKLFDELDMYVNEALSLMRELAGNGNVAFEHIRRGLTIKERSDAGN